MGSLERITVRGRQRLVVSWLRLGGERQAAMDGERKRKK